MPKTLAKANIQPLQSAFLCKGPLLCLKWRGPKTKLKKKPVTILSTIHAAKEVLTKKKDSHGNRISKPQCVQEYTQNMSGSFIICVMYHIVNFLCIIHGTTFTERK